MKILVTGGCGFIGSHYIKRHLAAHPQDEIVNLDKLTYAGRLENLKEVEKNPRYSFVKGDICEPKDVEKAIQGCEAIVHFAAESHVDRSIENASSFIQTDVIGTYILLEAARAGNIKKFVQISCYDEKTRALTTEGLKTFNKIKEGDQVLTINPTTQELEVKPVEKVIIQDYEGPMFHFKNARINLNVTPNHRMFILNTKRKMVIEEAERAAQRSVFYMPSGKWAGKDEEYYLVEGHGLVKTKDLLYFLGIFIGDGFTSYQEKKVATKSGLCRAEYLQTGRNGNGQFTKLENITGYESVCHSYRVFLDIPEEDKCRKQVEETLSALGIKYQAHKGKAGTHLYFTSKPWMDFLEQCEKGAENKNIPRWALEYSPQLLQFLFEGLLDSDGSGRRLYHTTSEPLVARFCELCTKIGLKPSVGKRHSVSYLDGRKIEGDAFYICVSPLPKSITKKRITKTEYKGKIWCLKVKDNKNFLTEREGRLDFCGNTDEVYGQILKGSFTEESLLMPRNPYSASKVAADRLAYSFFATYGLPVSITRSSNNYGSHQFPEKVIPLFVTNLIRGKKVPVYGTGKNVRDWLYVKDNCEAIDSVLQKGKNGEVYNIGGGNEKTNMELTRMLLDEFGFGEEMIQFVEDRKGHDLRYSLDYSKISGELGWKPKTPLSAGIQETVSWYKQNEWWWKPLVKK